MGYHHGDLKGAILRAAEEILEEEGIQGLTLRGAARRAGASHAAPKNHFGDLSGLLSELAAVGFARFRDEMLSGVREGDPPASRSLAVGRGYVRFARRNPGLFLLMFRSEQLDMERPALREAAQAASAVLAGTTGGHPGASAPVSLAHAVQMVGAWSTVHGLAMLLLDGRLDPLVAHLPEGVTEEDLVAMVLTGGECA